jgi:HD-GYP domain-containing protein (c-di-GMP phosphodiesterase class II)
VLKPSAPPKRLLVFLSGIVPILFAAVAATYRPPLLARLDDAAYDVVVRSAGTRNPSGRVAIVDVDERSLAAIGQWPWRRDVMGRLVTALHQSGAAAIAIDVIFAESDRHEGAEADPGEASASDGALAATLRDSDAVLGYGLTFDPGSPAKRCGLQALPLAIVQPPGGEDDEPFFHATGAVCNLSVLTDAARHAGFLNAAPDADGILRRAPLLVELDGKLYPSLALTIYGALMGVDHPTLNVSTVNASTLTIGDLSVPLDGKSNLLLGFRGKKRSFPYYAAADVLNGTVTNALRGKIVLVGTTALGTREVVATPLDTQFVGVEVQATAIDDLLQRDFIHRSVFGTSLDALIAVLAGAAVAALVAGSGVTAGLIGAVGLIAAFWWGATWLLAAQRLVIAPLSPTLSVVSTLGITTLARFTVERSRARRAGLEKTAAQRLMVQALLSLTEVRDAETGRHSLRTQQYARLLADPLSKQSAFRDYLTKERIDLLSRLAPLHDIGKVGIPDRILNKPGALTPDELAEMRRHPELGREVILRAESRVGVYDDAVLQLAKDIVYTHHERWDGTGYPRGLQGTEIPIPGRIMAVVDVYDATRSRSLYKPCQSHDNVVKLIVAGRETHFDPDVVDAFLRVSKAFEELSAVESGAASGEGAANSARPAQVPGAF